MTDTAVPRAVLFDLDDTLLANDMEVFIPAYFQALSAYARERYESVTLITALRAAIVQMMSSPGRRNSDVFWECFAPSLGASRQELEPYFARFYEEEFGRLRTCTRPVPGARETVDWFRSRGSRVVLATNPVYPHSAIVQRLQWAGFQPEEFELLTSYENMYSTKPDVAYYREILHWLQLPPYDVLMVGNDPANDIEPARAAGMRTFHVIVGQSVGAPMADAERGTLEAWHRQLARPKQ